MADENLNKDSNFLDNSFNAYKKLSGKANELAQKGIDLTTGGAKIDPREYWDNLKLGFGFVPGPMGLAAGAADVGTSIYDYATDQGGLGNVMWDVSMLPMAALGMKSAGAIDEAGKSVKRYKAAQEGAELAGREFKLQKEAIEAGQETIKQIEKLALDTGAKIVELGTEKPAINKIKQLYADNIVETMVRKSEELGDYVGPETIRRLYEDAYKVANDIVETSIQRARVKNLKGGLPSEYLTLDDLLAPGEDAIRAIGYRAPDKKMIGLLGDQSNFEKAAIDKLRADRRLKDIGEQVPKDLMNASLYTTSPGISNLLRNEIDWSNEDYLNK